MFLLISYIIISIIDPYANFVLNFNIGYQRPKRQRTMTNTDSSLFFVSLVNGLSKFSILLIICFTIGDVLSVNEIYPYIPNNLLSFFCGGYFCWLIFIFQVVSVWPAITVPRVHFARLTFVLLYFLISLFQLSGWLVYSRIL